MQSPQGDGNLPIETGLKNVALPFEKCSPRKGTETMLKLILYVIIMHIWEMQSPQGDGNVLLPMF